MSLLFSEANRWNLPQQYLNLPGDLYAIAYVHQIIRKHFDLNNILPNAQNIEILHSRERYVGHLIPWRYRLRIG